MEAPTSESPFRYWAFISYSSRNKDLARRLHHELETYPIPREWVGKLGRDGPIPAHLFPCFRDREELPLASDLGTTLQDALRASRYLIVICTPQAAQSLWVNHEILYFKSLGRADRILALIASGEPNSTDRGHPEQECFPPALRFEVNCEGQMTQRRAEPIGGDIRPGGDGWRISVLKAIAGITGLGLNAFIHRENKRNRRNQLILAGVLLLALAVLYYEWDFHRTKITYYQSMERVFGIPMGMGALYADTAEHREITHKFESTQGKVRKITIVNGSGALEDSETLYNSCQFIIHYRETGELDYVSFLNRNNHEVFQETFSGLRDSDNGMKQQTVDFKAKDVSNNLNQSFGVLGFNALEKQTTRKSDITGIRVNYDDKGFKKTVHFINSAGSARPNGDGIFGQSYDYDDHGNAIRITNLDENDNPQADMTGLICEECTYDANGYQTEQAYYGKNHQPVLSRFGIAKVDFKFDAYGNPIERDFFGIDGNPKLNKDHIAKIKLHYDDHGNLDEASYYGVDGSPTWNGEGFARKKAKYDDLGNEVELRIYGTSGNPILGPDGCFRTTKKYDAAGNVIEAEYFGIDNTPALNRFGHAKATWKYNEQGLPIERRWFGLDNNPVLGLEDGSALTTIQYNSQGNLTEADYYGIDGSPILNRHGYFRERFKFDSRNNMTELRYLGLDEKPIVSTDGFAITTLKYDDRGNLEEQEYFDPDGNPTLCAQGFFKVVLKYSERGLTLEKAFYGIDDNLVVAKLGYARITWSRDASNGRSTPKRYDAQGNLITGPNQER